MNAGKFLKQWSGHVEPRYQPRNNVHAVQEPYVTSKRDAVQVTFSGRPSVQLIKVNLVVVHKAKRLANEIHVKNCVILKDQDPWR